MASNAEKLGTVAVLGIYATLALDSYSTFCSSPQTTELNAKTRAPTLMKWVAIGGGFAVTAGAAASVYSGSWAPFAGSLTIAAMMYLFYRHAKEAGLRSGDPPTESHNGGWGG